MKDTINKLLNENKTLLGVGPMSKNCVDVVIDICNKHQVPIQLIASRRQIETKKIEKGYVNSWTTETFSEYVKKNDKNNLVLLARDHGGPWQNNSEVKEKMDLSNAINSSKESFKADIQNDFSFIHIDPSVDINNEIKNEDILNRLFDLYQFCIEISNELNKEIFIEVGTEEQIEGTNEINEVSDNLNRIINFCNKNSYSLPVFYVVQNGSKVLETENTGVFQKLNTDDFDKNTDLQKIRQISQLCLSRGILPKAHNSDYLNFKTSSLYPKVGLKGGNIAPEFGVIESKTIFHTLKKYGLNNELDQFIEISYNSFKWKKWLKSNTKSDDVKKAIISGHYIFSKPEFIDLKNKIEYKLKNKKIDIDNLIKNELTKSIKTYLNAYGWDVN
jgi:hypothetical protein